MTVMINPESWYRQVEEEIVEPERAIVDTHFHLWRNHPPFIDYLLEDLWADTGSGHNVEQMVFLECQSEYLTSGSESMRPVGETRFVGEAAARAAATGKTRIGAIVGTADLLLGAAVEEVLQAQIVAGVGLFRGIRYSAAWDASDQIANASSDPGSDLLSDRRFREGFARLTPLGLSYDCWLYHTQLGALADLARAFPETIVVANHLGCVLGSGPYHGRRDEIFEEWRRGIAALSECPNVIVKLGGLAQPANGFGWEARDRPPTSDEFASTYSRYYLHAIEQFGPERCTFESNFPVDRMSVSYHVLWNAFKKMVADFSEAEKELMFRGTATRVYGLDPVG